MTQKPQKLEAESFESSQRKLIPDLGIDMDDHIKPMPSRSDALSSENNASSIIGKKKKKKKVKKLKEAVGLANNLIEDANLNNQAFEVSKQLEELREDSPEPEFTMIGQSKQEKPVVFDDDEFNFENFELH